MHGLEIRATCQFSSDELLVYYEDSRSPGPHDGVARMSFRIVMGQAAFIANTRCLKHHSALLEDYGESHPSPVRPIQTPGVFEGRTYKRRCA